jgi:hypothetical protein
VPVILVLARRRLDALRVFCMFAGAFAPAQIGKKLIGEHRPSASLWAMEPWPGCGGELRRRAAQLRAAASPARTSS